MADGLSRLLIKHIQHGIFNLGEIESFYKAQLNKEPLKEKQGSPKTHKDPVLTKVLRGITLKTSDKY